MLENMTPPKPLPKVKDKKATINCADAAYTGNVLDINPTFVMVEIESGDYLIVPWDKVETIVVDVPNK